MKKYMYSTSYYKIKNRSLLVTDESGEIVFEIKQNRFFLRGLKRFFFETVKYTYRLHLAKSKEQRYLVHSNIKGYYLQITDSKKKIRIKNKRYQLLEKTQHFNLHGQNYTFEVNATRLAVLREKDKVVATAGIVNLLAQNEDNQIVIEALTEELAMLCIVLYQSFHMAKYEGKYIT